ncbi:MAG: NAD(P)/FAD-dependent oxidoreductase [Chlorobiota bacterium]
MKNFLIIGGGLAGITLAHQLQERNLSFTIVDNHPNFNSSKVAAGFWNPVVYKRLTESYNASILLPYLKEFYGKVERKLNIKFAVEVKQLRIFADREERNRFIDKALASEISQYLDEDIVDSHDGVKSPHGLGIVTSTGKIDTITYLQESINYFQKSNSVIETTFEYDDLVINPDRIEYNDEKYERIAFCEGYKAIDNPYFQDIKLKPTKGEALILEIPDLSQEYSITRGVSLIPLGENKFWLGSNYSWDDMTEEPTQKAKEELTAKLDKFLDCDYRIIDHQAGIRPAAHDRRPITKKSDVDDRLYILNGFGTKGVMYAPFYSGELVEMT